MHIFYRSFLLFFLSCLAQTGLCAETAVERNPQWAEPVDRSVNMHRLVYQGWSKEDALQELTQGGYGYHAMWKNIPSYLLKVDIEKIRRAVEAH